MASLASSVAGNDMIGKYPYLRGNDMVPLEYVVAKTITINRAHECFFPQIRTYWGQENMTFVEASPLFRAHRGSLLFNGFAVDPAKVKSELTISCYEASFDCLLRVDTRLQDMTDWTKAFFHLEMNTFESFLLYHDRQDQLWSSFFREFDAAFVRWYMTFMFAGRRMTREQWSKYTGLQYIR